LLFEAKTPLIVLKDGKIVEVSPERIGITKHVYSKIDTESFKNPNATSFNLNNSSLASIEH
jgi:hypothetical protein